MGKKFATVIYVLLTEGLYPPFDLLSQYRRWLEQELLLEDQVAVARRVQALLSDAAFAILISAFCHLRTI